MKRLSNKRKKHLKLLRKIELIRINKLMSEIEMTPIFAPDFYLSWREFEDVSKARGENA